MGIFKAINKAAHILAAAGSDAVKNVELDYDDIWDADEELDVYPFSESEIYWDDDEVVDWNETEVHICPECGARMAIIYESRTEAEADDPDPHYWFGHDYTVSCFRCDYEVPYQSTKFDTYEEYEKWWDDKYGEDYQEMIQLGIEAGCISGYDDDYDCDDDDGEYLDEYDAALIWGSHGKDDDYTFGYSEDELNDALK